MQRTAALLVLLCTLLARINAQSPAPTVYLDCSPAATSSGFVMQDTLANYGELSDQAVRAYSAMMVEDSYPTPPNGYETCPIDTEYTLTPYSACIKFQSGGLPDQYIVNFFVVVSCGEFLLTGSMMANMKYDVTSSTTTKQAHKFEGWWVEPRWKPYDFQLPDPYASPSPATTPSLAPSTTKTAATPSPAMDNTQQQLLSVQPSPTTASQPPTVMASPIAKQASPPSSPTNSGAAPTVASQSPTDAASPIIAVNMLTASPAPAPAPTPTMPSSSPDDDAAPSTPAAAPTVPTPAPADPPIADTPMADTPVVDDYGMVDDGGNSTLIDAPTPTPADAPTPEAATPVPTPTPAIPPVAMSNPRAIPSPTVAPIDMFDSMYSEDAGAWPVQCALLPDFTPADPLNPNTTFTARYAWDRRIATMGPTPPTSCDLQSPTITVQSACAQPRVGGYATSMRFVVVLDCAVSSVVEMHVLVYASDDAPGGLDILVRNLTQSPWSTSTTLPTTLLPVPIRTTQPAAPPATMVRTTPSPSPVPPTVGGSPVAATVPLTIPPACEFGRPQCRLLVEDVTCCTTGALTTASSHLSLRLVCSELTYVPDSECLIVQGPTNVTHITSEFGYLLESRRFTVGWNRSYAGPVTIALNQSAPGCTLPLQRPCSTQGTQHTNAAPVAPVVINTNPNWVVQGMIDTVAWLNPSNSSTCAMQSEGMLPQSFYMRGWMNNTSSSRNTSTASRAYREDNMDPPFNPMHNGNDSIRNKGFNPQELRFSLEIRDKLSRTYREIKPTIVGNNADHPSFVNMSFLRRFEHGAAPPANMVRRVSSMSLPSQESEAHQPRPPQPTGQSSVQGSSSVNSALLATYSVSRRILEDAIMEEAAKDKFAAPEKSLQGEEARLRQRLHRLRLDMLVVLGDGNCQFRAISLGLYGTQDRHAEVRAYAVAYMQRNPNLFVKYLGEEYKDYLSSMALSGTWGDELTLRAICEQYHIVINVIASTQSNWHLKYIPSKGPSSQEVFITYISPIHYNAIRRRTGLAPLRESFRIAPPQSKVQAAYKRATSTAKYIDSSSVV